MDAVRLRVSVRGPADLGEAMRKKPFLIVVSACGAFGIILFAAVFGVTGNLVTVADEFFDALEGGDYEAAYGCLSLEFHGNTTVAELQAFAQESALADYADATWCQRSISGDEGFLDGEVETKDGKCIPVTLALLKENDDWKIYQIDWYGPETSEGIACGTPSTE